MGEFYPARGLHPLPIIVLRGVESLMLLSGVMHVIMVL